MDEGPLGQEKMLSQVFTAEHCLFVCEEDSNLVGERLRITHRECLHVPQMKWDYFPNLDKAKAHILLHNKSHDKAPNKMVTKSSCIGNNEDPDSMDPQMSFLCGACSGAV